MFDVSLFSDVVLAAATCDDCGSRLDSFDRCDCDYA